MVWSNQLVGVNMREVPATEAKTRLAELLRVVEHGEAIAITRHGKTVAHLVPAGMQDRANRGKGRGPVPAAPGRMETCRLPHG